MSHILYAPAGAESATRLAAFMGLAATSAMNKSSGAPKWLIRYGSVAKIPLKPEVGVLNSASALQAQRDRRQHLALLRQAQLPTPKVFDAKPGEVFSMPVLGRTLKAPTGAQTHKGMGIVRYLPGSVVGKHDFFVEFIDKKAEFRVDVVGHHTRLRQLKAKDPKAVAWNTDGTFDHPTMQEPFAARPLAVAAVKALGLDFGAVDVLLDTEGRVFVLEVNTAPELTKPTLEWYAGRFGRMMGVPMSKMPGHEAVDWTQPEVAQ